VPHVIALALLGAGLYAGYRWLARAAGDMGARLQRPQDELWQQSKGPTELSTRSVLEEQLR
jgi:hypothetical protein